MNDITIKQMKAGYEIFNRAIERIQKSNKNQLKKVSIRAIDLARGDKKEYEVNFDGIIEEDKKNGGMIIAIFGFICELVEYSKEKTFPPQTSLG